MGGATEVLEHMGHAAHAGHGHGHGHGEGHPDGGGAHAPDRFGTRVGVTMATRGVVLAFCSAKVGAERTELVSALVEQQNAHSKYQVQDIKHRAALNNLRQLHSLLPAAGDAATLEAELKKIEADAIVAATAQKADGFAISAGVAVKAARVVAQELGRQLTPEKVDATDLAQSVNRYLREAKAASVWVAAFDPLIKAHVEASEHYELAQLAAEIGIVLASVALLLGRRVLWFGSIALGVAALGGVGYTYQETSHVIHHSEKETEEAGKAYRELREADKTTAEDQAVVDAVLAWSGGNKAATTPGSKEPATGGSKEPASGGHK